MKTTDSNDNDGHREMRDTLQRDAARVQDEPFDAALHYAAIRRIRALTGASQPQTAWRWWATAAACAVVLVLALLAAPWRSSQPSSHVVVQSEVPAPAMTPSSSAWAYQTAANESDETLLAMLDRDARVLLPPTASTFSTPLY